MTLAQKLRKKARGLRRGEETENKLQNSAEVKVFFWAMILFFSRTYFTRLFSVSQTLGDEVESEKK
jgi:hypothetical protein